MVATLAKTIKPKKLRVDKVRLNLLNALRAEGRAVAAEFEKTTASWEGEKPDFEILVDVSGNDAVVIVGPTGSDKAVNKWVWGDKGTKPHKIRAKNKPRLVFKTGASFPGGSFGPTVSKFEIDHPGTEGRGWSELVEKRRRKRFQQNVIKAARVVY